MPVLKVSYKKCLKINNFMQQQKRLWAGNRSICIDFVIASFQLNGVYLVQNKNHYKLHMWIFSKYTYINSYFIHEFIFNGINIYYNQQNRICLFFFLSMIKGKMSSVVVQSSIHIQNRTVIKQDTNDSHSNRSRLINMM